MYVIRVYGSGSDTNIHKNADTDRFVPADRCTWDIEPSSDGTGYSISRVVFYDGAGANGDGISATNNSFQFGYIGKSGRFVGMSE